MTIFFRLIEDDDKETSLISCIKEINSSRLPNICFDVEPNEFFNVPGTPFSYWVSTSVRRVFKEMLPLEASSTTAKQGLATADDFRFIRCSWEVPLNESWVNFAKGGPYSPIYADIFLSINWKKDGEELANFSGSVIRNKNYYRRPGITWSRRTTSSLSMRLLPKDCVFADKGPAVFIEHDASEEMLAIQAILSSTAFQYLVELQLAAADAAARSYEVGVIQNTPIPQLDESDKLFLSKLVREIWLLKYTLDSINENSHAFLLPERLRPRLGDFHPTDIISKIEENVNKIDNYCFKLYQFSSLDQDLSKRQIGSQHVSSLYAKNIDNTDDEAALIVKNNTLLSWVVGVVFGRFNWRLAYSKNEQPVNQNVFDALPYFSPGMLSSENEPFLSHQGILNDEPGHKFDLSGLIDNVLFEINLPIQVDTRSWLNRVFFSHHLSIYSKSRRQVPIYWPLQTPSGSYTLWVYYHRLNEQTLYICINDFVEPKLAIVTADLNSLRNKSARSTEEEKELAQLTDLEAELKDFRDELLRLAKFWKPNLNDGVQITAAPLWKLFQHKTWQKKLKETWNKLEEGDYDWAHLAGSIWPERVLRKCHQDRSLAIAHDVEDIFWHEVEIPIMRGKKPTGNTKIEWQPKNLTDTELTALIKQTVIGSK